jgi:uncharacterized Zn-finger protein
VKFVISKAELSWVGNWRLNVGIFRSFTRKEHYKNHILWHSGDTPHVCDICGKKYTRNEHLGEYIGESFQLKQVK